MIIRKTFKYRLKPNNSDRKQFAQFAGSCRWIYNFGLSSKKLAFEDLGESLSRFDLNNLLPPLKKEEETSWLKDVHSQILQQALNDLHCAYEHFFRRVKQGDTPGYPKFKKKGSGDSFRYPQGIKVHQSKVYLPKIGWVRFKKTREIEGEIKQATVIRELDEWYICFSCEVEKEVFREISEETVAGIDLGLLSYATIAIGQEDQIQEVENPRFLKGALKKLAFLSKSLSGKVYKSSNWKKARRRLQVFQRKLKNARKDFAHKLSTELVKNHDIVGVENLSVQSMLREGVSKLARSIADAGWRQFLVFLQYKFEYAGKVLVEADRWFASTKLCSGCNEKQELGLADRRYQCGCGVNLSRDANAAMNLKSIALKKYKSAGTAV